MDALLVASEPEPALVNLASAGAVSGDGEVDVVEAWVEPISVVAVKDR